VKQFVSVVDGRRSHNGRILRETGLGTDEKSDDHPRCCVLHGASCY